MIFLGIKRNQTLKQFSCSTTTRSWKPVINISMMNPKVSTSQREASSLYDYDETAEIIIESEGATVQKAK